MKRKFKTASAQFESLLIKQEDGHWILKTKPMRNLGYSCFTHAGVKYLAHIFAFEQYKGKVLTGNQVHHKCNYRRCCNPEHLESLTHIAHIAAELANITTINKVKTHCPQGHEFSAENTRIYKGHRSCKICIKARYTYYNARRAVNNGFAKIATKLGK